MSLGTCFGKNDKFSCRFLGVSFPKNFLTIAKTILKRLFRVYAHIYHTHFKEVCHLQEEAHLNTSFKHFIFFVQEFQLVDKRELAPLQELIDRLTTKDIDKNNFGEALVTRMHQEAAASNAEWQPAN